MKFRFYIAVIALLLIHHSSFSQSWDTVGDGLNFNVWGMLTNPNDNRLYVAGSFSASGSTPLSFVTAWDGSTFHALADGFNNPAYAFTLYNNELYCAGAFTSSGMVSCPRIARWDGVSWNDVGGGMDNEVYYLATFNGELYAGGIFSAAGGNPAAAIAKWNGTSWTDVGGGLAGGFPQVFSIEEYNGKLYVAGQFTMAGSVPVNNIASWDGTSWSDVGGGITGSSEYINDLYVFNGDLYATGSFTSAGGSAASSIAKWDGTSWSALGTGLAGGATYGTVFKEYQNELYVGGNFTSANGVSANRIARFNGSSWSALTSGCDQDVNAMDIFQNDLYLGGIFIDAGGLNASKIAKWNNCSLTTTVNLTQATCFGNCDGSIQLSPTGQSPFTFSWSNGDTTSQIGDLCAGMYIFTITDSTGCFITDSVEITSPAMTLTLSATSPTCTGMCDGITEAIASGTGPLTYSWNSVPVQVTSVATGLCAGIYTVVVTDSLGCSVSDSIEVTDPSFTLVLFADSPSCNQVCDGQATALFNSPALPYSYSWNTNPPQNQETATGLCSGTYIVTITDSNNCSASDSITVADPDYIISFATVSPSCQQFCDGEATALMSSPFSPHTYYWDTNPQQSTQTATGLCAGSYVVTVTDSNQCAVTDTVELLAPPSFPLTFFTRPESCPALCDGLAAVSPSSAASPYQFIWNTFPVQNTDTATNLCPGVYTVTVIDSTGCASTDSVTVPESPIQLIYSITPATCSGGCDGSITVTHNGIPPFVYNWLNGDSVQTISGLCPAVYPVTVTDSSGCSISGFPEIATPQPPVVSLTGFPIQCFNECNGEVSSYVTGNAPFSYLWSNGSTNPLVDSLCSGWFTVTVTDAGGCTTVDSLLLFPPNPVTINMQSILMPDCNGNCNGAISVVASGGQGAPFSYLWNDGQTSDSIFGLCADNYTVTGFDSAGCASDPLTLTIIEPDPLVITLTPTNASCQACNDGAIAFSVTGGTAPYIYFWSPPVSNLFQLTTGWYSLCATDGHSCQQCDSVFVGYTVGIITTGSTDHQLNIQPNPMNQSAIVLIPGSASGKISVLDFSGRTMKEENLIRQNTYLLQRNDFSSGVYFVIFTDEQGYQYQSRIVIN
ncbi:MAG: T9SS type A sorting domain-containing protein [Bacteroidia bacterium]|nr:T9SS type A sorting domain-containing protein [Bacteroidia bacterium]MCZ2276342.1 T9SS type A sorting domain-containing protein [Bacteroidia bacterium]